MSYYDGILWTGWLINNRKVFLTVLETGKSNVKALAEPMSDESLLPGSSTADIALGSHMAEGVRELWDLSYVSVNPMHENSRSHHIGN